MRTRQQNREYIRKYRYNKKLSAQKLKENLCNYCGGSVETLHHINELHSDNRPENLLPVCNKCHLDIIHSCDKPNYYKTDTPDLPRNRISKLKNAVIPKKTIWDVLNNCNTNRIYNLTLLKPNTSKKIHISEGSRRLVELFSGMGYTEVI